MGFLTCEQFLYYKHCIIYKTFVNFLNVFITTVKKKEGELWLREVMLCENADGIE
jgi:hypothetical protein